MKTFDRAVLRAVYALGGRASTLEILGLLEHTSIARIYMAIDHLETVNMVQLETEVGGPERGGIPRLFVRLTGHGLHAARNLSNPLVQKVDP